MARILIAGLINIETTLRVEHFPLTYEPVRFPFFGVRTSVSGVGYNLALALSRLGHEVRLASMVGHEELGDWVRRALEAQQVQTTWLLATLDETPQSVIIYNQTGQRQIHTDLKDVQEQAYPPEQFALALNGCDLVIAANINFARPLLALAHARNIPIATDVHAIATLHDSYNRDYMAAAEILFMSHEQLPCPPEAWVAQVQREYGTPIIGVGMGAAGALLAVQRDGYVGGVPAVEPRPVVNTIGSGDALFASFLHGYLQSGDPYYAMRQAVVYAGYKVGGNGGADGLLTAAELAELCQRLGV
ncbi:MAG: carbohydrate kinase family protein [Chloroflexaceae bacterium]|jgi:ribokinase|nr:carbohydrate kinase family protein [Chloroflexaceae bacterium]